VPGNAGSVVGAACILGVLVVFLLMRQRVLDVGEGPWRRQPALFDLVNLLALPQTMVVSTMLARRALPALDFDQHREAMAQAMGVAVPLLSSCFGHRHARCRR
jgi:hypothetical protein